jgi:signal transduction histidine kinase
VKAIVDVAVDKAGALAGSGAIALVLALAPAAGAPVLFGIAALFSLLGLALSRRLHRGYVQTLEQSLLAGRVRLDAEEVLELLHSEVIRHGVDVERMLETNLTVRANKTQIQQVILNLTINALEAMAEQPAGERILRIKAKRTDGKAQVSVSDTGVGIAEDMLERVFEGFYATKPQGLGVGALVGRQPGATDTARQAPSNPKPSGYQPGKPMARAIG